MSKKSKELDALLKLAMATPCADSPRLRHYAELLYRDTSKKQIGCLLEQALTALVKTKVSGLTGAYLFALLLMRSGRDEQDETVHRLVKLLPTMHRRNPGRALALAYHLAFIEPFLASKEIREQLLAALEQIPDAVGVPAIRDTLFGWTRRREFSDSIIPQDKTEHLRRLHILSVHSVKGGVGKTLICNALAFLLGRDAKARVCVLDLDYNGPSLQYLYDMPKFVRPLPGQQHLKSGLGECCDFDQFYRALHPATSFEKTWLRGKQNPKRYIHRVNPQLSLVPLTHSTVRLPYVAAAINEGSALVTIIDALDRIAAALLRSGITHLLIDSGPGLYAHQGRFMKALAGVGARLAIVSSARIYDVFATSYEMGWLMSQEEFPLSPLWIVNGWNEGVAGQDIKNASWGPVELMQELVCGSRKLPCNCFGKRWQFFADCASYARYFFFDEAINDHVRTYNKGRLSVVVLPHDDGLRALTSSFGSGLAQSANDTFQTRLTSLAPSWLKVLRASQVHKIAFSPMKS